MIVCYTQQGTQVEVVNDILNHDVNHILDWCNSNNMVINVKKSCCIVLGTAQRLASQHISHLSIRINDDTIEHLSKFRLLGVEIDNKLSWTKHIDYLVKKINLRLRIFYRKSKFLPFSAKLSYYHSFISPHLDYCNAVWGGAAACEINRLTRLQKRSARAITGV